MTKFLFPSFIFEFAIYYCIASSIYLNAKYYAEWPYCRRCIAPYHFSYRMPGILYTQPDDHKYGIKYVLATHLDPKVRSSHYQ